MLLTGVMSKMGVYGFLAHSASDFCAADVLDAEAAALCWRWQRLFFLPSQPSRKKT